MDYKILANEITVPQYAGMTDAEIADALNALPPPTRGSVAISAVMARAYELGVYPRMVAAQWDDRLPAELRAVIVSLLDLKSARFDTINFDDAVVVAMFGTLQQAGLLSAEEAAAFDSLANVPVPSRAQALGLGTVTADNVHLARAWYEYDALIQRLQAGAAIAAGWLHQQRDAGAAVPDWSVVLERM